MHVKISPPIVGRLARAAADWSPLFLFEFIVLTNYLFPPLDNTMQECFATIRLRLQILVRHTDKAQRHAPYRAH